MKIVIVHDNHINMSGPDFVTYATILVLHNNYIYRVYRRKHSRSNTPDWWMDVINDIIPEYAAVHNWYSEETEWLSFLKLKDAIKYIRSCNGSN